MFLAHKCARIRNCMSYKHAKAVRNMHKQVHKAKICTNYRINGNHPDIYPTLCRDKAKICTKYCIKGNYPDIVSR